MLFDPETQEVIAATAKTNIKAAPPQGLCLLLSAPHPLAQTSVPFVP